MSATTDDKLDELTRRIDAREARRAAQANGGRPALRLVTDDERAPVLELSDHERIERSLASIDASLARFDARRDGRSILRVVD